VFDRVLRDFSNAPFFARKVTATGRHGLTPLQLVFSVLLMMSNGYSAASVDRELGISESSAMESLKQCLNEVVRCYSAEVLRDPTEKDLQRILAIYAARGFPGWIGCIDCQHYEWEACPIGLAGQFKGKESKSTIVLERIADAGLRIWHVVFGSPGSMNDINVLDNSSTVESIIAGDFPPKSNYRVNGNTYTMPYYLADGIHLTLAIFKKWSVNPCQESIAYLLHSKRQCGKMWSALSGCLCPGGIF
jgi:Plant transposon protein